MKLIPYDIKTTEFSFKFQPIDASILINGTEFKTDVCAQVGLWMECTAQNMQVQSVYFITASKTGQSVESRLKTAALAPIGVRHLVQGELVEIDWTIEHWTKEETAALLYYEMEIQIEPDGREKRQATSFARMSNEYVCGDLMSCTKSISSADLGFKMNIPIMHKYTCKLVGVFRGNMKSAVMIELGSTTDAQVSASYYDFCINLTKKTAYKQSIFTENFSDDFLETNCSSIDQNPNGGHIEFKSFKS